MDEVIINDSKGNKKTFEGNIEGFLVKKYPVRGKALLAMEPYISLDKTWQGKQIAIILLEKPDLEKK